MKRWLVETRSTSRKFYVVEAEDERSAIYSSTLAPPEAEEGEYEETISVSEIGFETHPDQTSPMTVERERFE